MGTARRWSTRSDAPRIEKLVGEEDHGLIDDLYADDVPMLDGPPEQGEEERIIPMRISLQDVVELSSRSVGGFSHRLELVPHYLFSYQVPLYVGEGKIGGREGTMAVNALTKDVQSWDQVPGDRGQPGPGAQASGADTGGGGTPPPWCARP